MRSLAFVAACFLFAGAAAAEPPGQGRPGSQAERGPTPQEAGQGGASSQKERDIRRLIAMTGADALAYQMLDQMMAAIKASPDADPAILDVFRAEMRVDELVDLVVAIYEKHLSHEEVLGLIAFHESPLGRRMIVLQPILAAESMEAGQTWAQRAAERALRRLSE